jgi:2-polyprenyl-6-methoxyphenol hydroxylase-like FAD-dependent oxidoreductase
MEQYLTPLKPLWKTDVLVVGGGSAGASAALAAAMEGTSVALVERYGFMGGISTQVLDTFYGFYTPGQKPKKVVGGVPDRIVEALRANGKAIYRPSTYGAGQGITYDPETLKVIWEGQAREAGVRLLFHTLVVDAIREGERIIGVVAANKAGFFQLLAEVIIDASGDADVAAAMGVPYESAQDGPVQSLTTTFRLINVDVDRAREVDKETLHGLMAEAAERGEYDLPRREGSVHITPLAGVMATNMTRVAEVDPTDPLQLSEAEGEGRRQALEYARFMREKVPGYERSELSKLSTQIGVRESRRIYGAYRLSREDVLSARAFEDAIAKCGAPIEEHHAGGDTRWEYLPEGETYDIPYRCLLPQRARSLLVAGRCLSADHDAHASVRSMGQCMAMGQAAGVAAALAAERGTDPAEVSIDELQARLRALGAIL